MYIIDAAVILFLFILGTIIKRFLYKWLWLIPTAMIAGVIGISISPQGFNFYRFHGDFKFYIDIFLAVVFATFPLTINDVNFSFIRQVKKLWQYSILQYFTQWGFSLFITILLFKNLWPFLDDSFGLILPSGYAGGHGSAAVVGDLLNRFGKSDALTLAMSMATVGAFSSIVGGMMWIYWAHKKGIVQKGKMDSPMEFHLDLQSFHLPSILLLGIIIFIAAMAKPILISVLKFDVPIFVIGVVVSFLTRLLIQKKFTVHQQTSAKLANGATDLLVCIGITSIEIAVVAKYFWPMLVMAILGLLICILYFLFLTPKVFEDNWFEKGLFTWGWSVGGVVFGLALVKIVSSEEGRIRLLQQFAMTYLLLSPIEISLLLSMPYLTVQGYGLIISIFLILLAVTLIKFLLKKPISN